MENKNNTKEKRPYTRENSKRNQNKNSVGDIEKKISNAINLENRINKRTNSITKERKYEKEVKQDSAKTQKRTTNTKKVNEKEKDFKFKKSNLKVIALGGLEEIGKNMTVFEYEDEIVIVDCGLEFPTDDMLGVDLVIPDTTYLEKNKEKIKAIVITHGHEDHIGSIPYFLKKVNVPIYASKLAIGLIENKLEEHGLLRSAKLKTVVPGQTINLGKMKVEFIRSCHSIPDAMMLAIYTPVGIIMHTGDFKIDYTPINSEATDLNRIAEIGKKGVLLLLSDSTNAENKDIQCLKEQ